MGKGGSSKHHTRAGSGEMKEKKNASARRWLSKQQRTFGANSTRCNKSFSKGSRQLPLSRCWVSRIFRLCHISGTYLRHGRMTPALQHQPPVSLQTAPRPQALLLFKELLPAPLTPFPGVLCSSGVQHCVPSSSARVHTRVFRKGQRTVNNPKSPSF